MRLSKEIATGSVGNGATQIVIAEQSGTATSALGGVDVHYLFSPRLGAGVFARDVWAKVDLPAASGVKVGGFQSGVGLHLRF